MSGRVGLEVAARVIRGVVMSRWRQAPTRTFEVAWDPAQPASALAALRAHVEAPDAVCVAIGLAFLHVARVQLPPSEPAAREAMVQVEPQRFFAVGDTVRAALGADGDVAFAADASWLAGLEAALNTWGPIARVEPTPLAVLAAWRGSNGTYTLDTGDGEWGALEVRDGALVTVRRGPSATAIGTRPLPDGAVPGTHLAALGALLRDDAPLVGSLLTPAQRTAARRRVGQGIATAVLAAAAGIAFLFVAADRSRERTLAALETTAARLTSEARPALEARARLASRQREVRDVRIAQGERADPAAALAAIGTVLPRDVILLSVRAKGHDWQIDGTARNAAALVPLLDADPRFDSVRSLSASSRFRDGSALRESFSIAVHVRPTS